MNLDEFLSAYPEDISQIATTLRDRILEIFPDAVETMDSKNLGFGFGKGYKNLVFVIAPYRSHITLGIARGAELEDDLGLLEGSGKIHRHVKIRSIQEVENPDLNQLMTSALLTARDRFERRE